MNVREKLVELLEPHVSGLACEYESGSCELTSCRSCNARNLADHLISNGVTVQEWVPVSEPPKEKGTYIVCTDKGGILLGHWYGKEWNVGGGAKKHLAYWMKKPNPPKGE